jgi:hypothetical protein
MARSLISLIAGFSILSNSFPDIFTTYGDEKEVDKIVDILINEIGVKGEKINE